MILIDFYLEKGRIMNWKAWLHSIAAAAIGGASNAALGSMAMPDTFNFTHAGLLNLGKIAAVGALVPVLTLLKQSPLPDESTAKHE